MWAAILPASSVLALFCDALQCQLLQSCSLIACQQNAHLASLLFIGFGAFFWLLPVHVFDTLARHAGWTVSFEVPNNVTLLSGNIWTRLLRQFLHVNLVAERSNHHEGTGYRWANAQLKDQCNGCINQYSIRALCPDMCLQQLLLALHTSTHGYVALV